MAKLVFNSAHQQLHRCFTRRHKWTQKEKTLLSLAELTDLTARPVPWAEKSNGLLFSLLLLLLFIS